MLYLIKKQLKTFTKLNKEIRFIIFLLFDLYTKYKVQFE